MSELTLSKTKIHRHFVPKFSGTIPKLPILNRFIGAIKKHDWNRNPHIYKLRTQKKQRISVRSERRETWNELAIALVAHADYNSFHDDMICEVMCSTEHLAKLCGQLYQYDSGRVSLDPIRKALKDWEAAGLIYVHKEKDLEAKQYKAQRIWLRPKFFTGMGFSITELRKILTSFNRWLVKTGKLESHKERYAKYLLKLANLGVSSIDDCHKLKRLLSRTKEIMVGKSNEALKNEKKHIQKALEQKLALAQSLQQKDSPERAAWKRYTNWKNQQPLSISLAFEKEMKKLYPNVRGQAIYLCYINHLPDH